MLCNGLWLIRNRNLFDSAAVRTTIRNLDPDDTQQFALRFLCASPCSFLRRVSTEAPKPCGRAGIGRRELILRTVSPSGAQVDLPVDPQDPQGRRVIEMELLRGSLARQDFSLMHDSKSCPPVLDGYGNPLANPAPPGPAGTVPVERVVSALECATDEVPPPDRRVALYGVTMQPPVSWATVSGAATQISVGEGLVYIYGVPYSVSLGGLLPCDKGMSIAFDATAAEGDLPSGVHETVLTISYRQANSYANSGGDAESFPGCGGLLAPSGEQGLLCADLIALELLLRFKVVQPSYFLLLAPSNLDLQMAAGSAADYTFQLYNAMPGPLEWHIRCADLPTAAGVIRLAVDTSTVPCGAGAPSGTGTLEFQGEGSLTLSVTAPDVVQNDPYTYVLHIPATNENGAMIVQTLPISVVVVAEMLAHRSLTRLLFPTSVTAGEPMVVEVRAKDQYNNIITAAGLSFSMDVTAADPQNPWATARTFLSRFTVDGYIIETDAIPQQGAYLLTATNSDNQERIGGGSDPSFEIQVEPITCSGANSAPDEYGLVCVCSPGYGRGTNEAGLHVCVPCTETTAGGSGTLYSSAATAGECIPCLDGTRPNAAQSACDDCPVGAAGVGGRCTACDAGKVPEPNRQACEFCPAGKQPNADQSDCVQCAVGSATTIGNCIACITGWVPVSNEAGDAQARCDMCPSGRQANEDQSDCVDCEVGWVANTGVCQACDAGKRPVDGGSRCEVCPAGKQPNEDQSDCVDCAAGSATTIGVCQACGPGKITDDDQGNCILCAAGKQPTGNHSSCADCDVGKATGTPNAGICQQCASGKIPRDSQTRCGDCESGKQPGPGGMTCEECPPGSATTHVGICSPCANGKIPTDRSTRCEVCPAGKEPGENRTECVQCGMGEATTTGRCVACASGEITVNGQSDCYICSSGKQPAANKSSCEECAPGSASSTGECMPCSAGQVPVNTVAGPNHICQKCSTGSVTADRVTCEACTEGKTPNSDDSPTLCVDCADGKFRSRNGTTCETCPLGKAPNYNRTDCEVCPEGKAGATGSCETCPKGKTPDESKNFCEKCPEFSTTLEAGATTCVCENNYFSRSFAIVNSSDGNGAEPSLQCEKCPFGAVCEGISNSIYAKPGYWINVYQSSPLDGLDGDSSRSINPPQYKPVHCLKDNCIGYCDQDETETEAPACKPVPHEATPQLEPNACKLGSTGPLCAFCEDGEHDRANLKYRKVEGTCVKCDGIDWPNAFVTYGMYTLMCTFFLFKSRRILTGRDCDIHNSSCIIGISLFFVQTMVLLPPETFENLGFVKELAGAVSMSPDTPDQTDGKCLSFGDFYYDWLMKFSIPLYNITATVLLVFLAGLWKRSPWQGKMALFFALQSSLFAINLRAISLFFCRTDLSCGDQCPSSWLPHGHLRLDPSQSCSTGRHLKYLAVAACIFAAFAFGLPALLCKSIGERMDAHCKLLRIEAYLKYGFEQGAVVLQNKDWSDTHSAEYAARDYLSVIYYPLRRQKYWWAAVWIVRPTVIATVYNARDRGSGVAFGFADWRIIVVWLLMLYNCIQATVRPFKHVNESQLDSFSVLLLMSMFTVSINNDFVSAKEESLANAADRVAKVMTVVLVCLVVLATVQSKLRTAANIKKMIARDRWRSAWSHMSGNECDPLADVGKLVDHLEEDANKKTGVLAKLTQIGIAGVKLPVFEQIDVDESGLISLNEFLDWWRVRTIRTGMADEMREVAADLFGQFDADKSGEVDRDEFDRILTGLRDWHAKQRALMSQLEESPEARKLRIRIQREKVVENLRKHGWTESPAGWVRPEPVQLGTTVAGMINPIAASFEVDLPRSGVGGGVVGVVVGGGGDDATPAANSAKSAHAAGVPTVEEIFASIDSDRSGSVSFHEFSQWWTSHGGSGSMLEMAKRAFDLVAQRDGAPGVSIHGLKDVMVAVAAEGWTRATDPASGRQYFVNPATGTSSWLAPGIDAVGSFLERAGISREAATVTVYTPTLAEIFEEIDVNGSGVVEYDEFADWWEQNGGSQSSLALAQEAFGLIEMRDGVPGLGFTELKEVMIAVASDDWEEAVDPATGRKYFIDPHTRQTTWLVPGVEIVGPFLQRVGITRNGVRPKMRTRSSACGAINKRGQAVSVPSASNLAGQQSVKFAGAAAPVAVAAVTPVQKRVSDESKSRGDGPALMHAPVVDQVIAALDTTDTGQVLQSAFVSWWADRQAPGLAVMEKLKFSRPIAKHFATNGGALSTLQFRKLLLTLFEEEAKSSSATELNADHMNAWLHRLLIYI